MPNQPKSDGFDIKEQLKKVLVTLDEGPDLPDLIQLKTDLQENIRNTREPNVSIPIILKLIDHHRPEANVTGLELVQYLLESLPLIQLSERNLDNLLLASIIRLLHNQDPDVLDKTLVTLLQLLKYSRVNPLDISKGPATEADEAFTTIIKNLILTSDWKLKDIYWRHLIDYIRLMDIAVVKYSNSLMALIADHLTGQIVDERTVGFYLVLFDAIDVLLDIYTRGPPTEDIVSKLLLIYLRFSMICEAFLQSNSTLLNSFLQSLTKLRLCNQKLFDELMAHAKTRMNLHDITNNIVLDWLAKEAIC